MIRKIASGYYEIPSMPVTLIIDKYARVVETIASVEIMNREDGSGWSYTMNAILEDSVVKLSEHEDIYERKRDIIEFMRSKRSRIWEFVKDGDLNLWCNVPLNCQKQ